MQLSGDLGSGHTELLVKLTLPRFDFLEHGLTVGNNLLRAYVELGMFADARKLLDSSTRSSARIGASSHRLGAEARRRRETLMAK
jgi:hypothetical protein